MKLNRPNIFNPDEDLERIIACITQTKKRTIPTKLTELFFLKNLRLDSLNICRSSLASQHDLARERKTERRTAA